jgi:hypothetical protein
MAAASWSPHPHDGAERDVPRRVRAAHQEHVDTARHGPVDRVLEPVGDRGDRDAGPQDVVAAAVDAQECRGQGQGRVELLGDDRGEQSAPDGEIRVGDRRGRRGCESQGDEIGPAPDASVGQLVPDSLGETVADRDVARMTRVHASESITLLDALPKELFGKSRIGETDSR